MTTERLAAYRARDRAARIAARNRADIPRNVWGNPHDHWCDFEYGWCTCRPDD